MYEKGRGVDQNKYIAKGLYRDAAELGNEAAKEALRRLEDN